GRRGAHRAGRRVRGRDARRLYGGGSLMAELRYGAALNKALADAMDADPTVIVMGEDIAAAGGSFGVTRGLLDRFGAKRVLDTPISEAAIAGMAVGAAMSGL